MKVLAAAAALTAAGCGKSDAEKQAEAQRARSGTGPITCEGSATTESLEGMSVEYKDRLKEAGYTVQFSEIEQDRGDSEVACKTGGKSSTEGTVALRGGSSCSNGHVSVHITNRPSD